jgi:hypothetical protein
LWREDCRKCKHTKTIIEGYIHHHPSSIIIHHHPSFIRHHPSSVIHPIFLLSLVILQIFPSDRQCVFRFQATWELDITKAGSTSGNCRKQLKQL